MTVRRWSVLALVVFVTLRVQAQAPAGYDDLRKDARTAYEGREYPRYLKDMLRMDAIRPNHPTTLVNLAGANALNGQRDEALRIIRLLVAEKVYFDTADTDFDSLRSDSRFQTLDAQLKALAVERVGSTEIAFRIPEKGLITEGLAFDQGKGEFYVTSVRKGKILRIDGNGQSHLFTKSDSRLRGLSGIGIDGKRRILWACSTASPRFERFQNGEANEASLVGFNLKTGRIVRQIRPADGGAFFDDLTVGSDGTVFVSDSTGAILFLRPGKNTLQTLVDHGVIRSPQGSVLSADEKTLYVADYGGPIRRVDVGMGRVTPLEAPSDFQPMGIDGLTRSGRSLIAVQNGITPNRIVRLDLSADGGRIDAAHVLEMNHPLIDEPTIGTVVGRRYYFVGTSQGNKFDRGSPDPATLSDGLVFRIDLE